MVYKDKTTENLMLRLIDDSDTVVELPDQLKSKIIGSEFNVAITATGELLLKTLSGNEYMEFSIAKETVKESRPLTMTKFNKQTIALDTENGNDYIQPLDDKHTLIESRNTENQILLIKKNDNGALEKINLKLPQIDGRRDWFNGSINGKMITIRIEVDTQTNRQDISVLYDLDQGNYPVATMTTPASNTQQSSTPAQPSSTNTPQEITTTQNSVTTSISFRTTTSASTTVVVPTSTPAPTTNENGETTVTTTTNIGRVSTTIHHDGSTTTTTPNGEFSTPAPTTNVSTTVKHTTSGAVIITNDMGTTSISPNWEISSTPTPPNDDDKKNTTVISTSPLTQIPHQTNATIEKVIKSLDLQVQNGPSNLPTSTPVGITGDDAISGPIKTSTPKPTFETVKIPIPTSEQSEHKYSINLIVLGGVIIGASMVCTIAGVCIKRAINMSRVAHANDPEGDIEMQEVDREEPSNQDSTIDRERARTQYSTRIDEEPSNQFSTRIGDRESLSIVFSQSNDIDAQNTLSKRIRDLLRTL